MLIVVLITIVLLLIAIYSYYPSLREDIALLNLLHQQAVQVCVALSLPATFTLRASTATTYTVDHFHVHLLLRKADGSFFDRQTLLTVLLHEIAHTIITQEGHSANFLAMEKRLIGAATNLGYLKRRNGELNIDPEYPQHVS